MMKRRMLSGRREKTEEMYEQLCVGGWLFGVEQAKLWKERKVLLHQVWFEEYLGLYEGVRLRDLPEESLRRLYDIVWDIVIEGKQIFLSDYGYMDALARGYAKDMH